ncbi:MAG: PASTA domain-containing protein [Oscillospiraceae bacterium]|nr:PASTA domain-containing protein [Oscillospiraceae bacterium]
MAQSPKRRPDAVRRANRTIGVRTLFLLVLFGVLTFVLLFSKLYEWQITRHDELQDIAVRQQTMRTTVSASRGAIYDRNGRALAISSTAENILMSPLDIEKYDQDRDLIADGLAEILGLDGNDLREKMKKTYSQYEFIKKRVDQEEADRVRAFVVENDIKGNSIFMEPTTKRYYPFGSLAANVIGFVNENGGAMGLEAVYNEELTGESGMVVTAKDVNGTSLLYQYEQYFDAQDGSALHTTIDTTVQYYLEKGLADLEARYGTGKGATGIVMDVNTAAILGMASLPSYDLNNPAAIYNDFLKATIIQKPTEPSPETAEDETGETAESADGETGATETETTAAVDEKAFEEQLLAQLHTLRLKQWRNKAINDTYEPGSTFKILTLSMGLEEGVIDLNSSFDCSGYVKIDNATINCSKRAPGHGHQSLKVAAGNSCNPAFINIGLRVGNQKFVEYMNAFGLTSKTGIDTTGETPGFMNEEINYSRLALACYAFGQNFNVTPVALIAAQAACINGGYLRRPYIVDQITDVDGNIAYQHDTTPIRQVISEDTSATVREILEYVVSDGTGKNGKVAGYRIGGKTGTADKVGGNVIVSFVCFAPADDPQVIMLLTLDEPNRDTGTYVSGGNMVAPVASEVMAELLPYLGIEPTYSAEELVGRDTTVPNLVGFPVEEAQSKLKEIGFSCRVVGKAERVTDQTPSGGAIVPNNAEIILYCGETKSDALCIVPNVIGDSASVANQKLTNAGLIMSVSGATNRSNASVRAVSQSETPGREVDAGTVVRVQLSDSSVTD